MNRINIIIRKSLLISFAFIIFIAIGGVISQQVFATEANIISINYQYDFIVVDKGYNSGFSDGKVFYLLKNAAKIGKVQIRNAKPNIAACDVVGLTKGVKLQLGDKVTLRTSPDVSLKEEKMKYRWKEIPKPEEVEEKKRKKNKIIQKKKFTSLRAKAEDLAKEVAKEREQQLVSFNFKNADIQNVLRMISREKNLNILASGNVTGRVTVSFNKVNVFKALDAILHRLGYSYVKEDGIIKVIPLVKGEENTRYFIYQPTYSKVKGVKDAIKEMVSSNGKILLDEVVNQMMVIDTPSNLKRVKKFIKKLDVPPKQVMIECKFVDVKLENSEELGVEWGIESTSPTTPDTRMKLDYSGSSGLGIFKYGTIGTNELTATISALQQKKKVDILSEPSITTLNNKKANFELTRNLAYLQSTTETTDAGTKTTYSWQKLEKKPGISLNVTPHLTTDKKILLKVKPSAKILQETKEAPDGTQFPVVTERSADTEVLISDGHTLVIGGLIQKTKSKSKRGVPVLSNIPLLGIPFRKSSDSFERRELMIFITPHIVDSKFGKE